MQRKALGKGLDALFGSTGNERPSVETVAASRTIRKVALNDIIPNRNQPREHFSDEAMEDLKKSIAENGILEPPIVRRKGDYFEIIAGERRFRAARDLGLESIEVIVMEDISDEKVLVLSLVENIQRENLNAIEEARAYEDIVRAMNITQEQLSEIVGKSRSTIANTLRLLNLAAEVRTMVAEGVLAAGSARPLVAVEDYSLQVKLARRIASEGLSARKAESLVRHALSESAVINAPKVSSPFIDAVREDLQRILGTDVKLRGSDGRGKIEISYYSRDDLDRIIGTLRDDNISK